MASSTWTSAHLQQIEEAIASGVKRVKFADKEVEIVGLDDLIRTRDIIRKALGLNKKSSRTVASFRGGTK